MRIQTLGVKEYTLGNQTRYTTVSKSNSSYDIMYDINIMRFYTMEADMSKT